MEFQRSSGIIMHISSLHGKYGIGDLGRPAYEFVDFIADAGQKLWQILPMGPTGYGDSPYQSFSAFAGNHYFIDMESLVEKGFLEESDLTSLIDGNIEESVDFGLIHREKMRLLRRAYDSYLQTEQWEEVEEFKKNSEYWIEDYCLFMALKKNFGFTQWQKWPKDFRYMKKSVIKETEMDLCYEMEFHLFLQYIFYEQWQKLKNYANSKDIKIIGDIPIFVASDSVDAWSKSKMFLFDKYKRPKKLSGAPPDMFSKDGQFWGNPLYDWNYMEKTGYRWWLERVKNSFNLYDTIRIDHFRGFESFWTVRYGKKTARKGRWEKGPGMKLFGKINRSLGELPIIAEDLGFLTPKVRELLRDSGYPGMKILEFAFDTNSENEYLPHRYPKNCVAYTGTHDNDTVIGWYRGLDDFYRGICDRYLKNMPEVESEEINWKCIEAIWSSRAVMTITQMQDVIGLGSEARMNFPATSWGNWKWRIKKEDLKKETALRLKKITEKYNR
ncbi:4-alpha-glucanotransferase [uncultured Ilyobacter sp.]|uniref:4-alpha-glucanotransferase n=1 Tax=uncultured Ilyobacter sp. TaxID=544433 RepID=UPI0029C0C6AF|nr:4-alpha-glucanotransferase [uncultured Ilyobacter sp.]